MLVNGLIDFGYGHPLDRCMHFHVHLKFAGSRIGFMQEPSAEDTERTEARGLTLGIPLAYEETIP